MACLERQKRIQSGLEEPVEIMVGGVPESFLRSTYADGTFRLDFQRTRASKVDPCSRYYAPEEFDLVAACLHPLPSAGNSARR